MLVWRQLRNTEIIFNSSAATSGNYVGWNRSTDGKFAKKEVDGACYLRLVADVASASIVSNQIIGYEVSYMSNNVRYAKYVHSVRCTRALPLGLGACTMR